MKKLCALKEIIKKVKRGYLIEKMFADFLFDKSDIPNI